MGKKTKRCPMCGTMNEDFAETCSYCGYIFEDQLSSKEVQAKPQRSSMESSLAKGTAPDVQHKSSETASEKSAETILKTQKHIVCKSSLIILEGTLYLTTKRLLYVAGESDEGDLSVPADTNNIQQLVTSPNNISIPFETIASVLGQRGILRPSLVVMWHSPPDNPATTKTEFVQKIKSRADGNIANDINNWTSEIEEMSVSETEEMQTSFSDEESKDPSSLAPQILEVLDSSWKGFFQIESDLEERKGKSLDPDAIEQALKKLVREKLVEQDKYGHFFRKLVSQTE